MAHRDQYAQLLEPLLRQAGGYARSIVRDRHMAQDAVQQAALRGLEKLHTFDDTRSFKAWWFSIVHNSCIDLLRGDRSASHLSIDDFDVDECMGGAPQKPDWERLIACMAQLSMDHGEILRLKYFADMSYRELAEALTIPQGTVMSRLHLARLALAEKMREEE